MSSILETICFKVSKKDILYIYLYMCQFYSYFQSFLLAVSVIHKNQLIFNSFRKPNYSFTSLFNKHRSYVYEHTHTHTHTLTCPLTDEPLICTRTQSGFPGGLVVKHLPANAGDVGLIPASGRSTAEGNDSPLQGSWLGNHMDKRAWQATVPGVTRSQTRPSY